MRRIVTSGNTYTASLTTASKQVLGSAPGRLVIVISFQSGAGAQIFLSFSQAAVSGQGICLQQGAGLPFVISRRDWG